MFSIAPDELGLHGIDVALVQGKPHPRAPGPLSAPIQIEPPHVLKILMLEDEPNDAELIRRELRKAGLDFTARRVDTRTAFVEALETFAPDIVLADYKLPNFNGGEALAHARNVHPEVPVVMVTGALGDEAAIDLLHAGAKDYVLKSNLLRLPSAVERAISGEDAIRARKSAEAALRASNALLETAERLAHIGGFDWDIASGRITWSEETYRMFGLASDEFVPTLAGFVEFVHPDDRPRMQDAIDATVKRNQPFDIEFRIVRPDKVERVIHSRGEIVRNAIGQPTRMTGTSQDITERKRIADALRASEARYRDLFETTRDAIMLLEPSSGSFIAANPSTLRLFGAKAEEELLSRKPWEVSPERQPDGRSSAEKAHEMIETAMRDGFHLFEWTHKRLDGVEFPADVFLSRVVRGDETLIYASVRDITDRREAERTLRRLNRTLRTLSRGNEVLVRTTSEPELLREMCRVIVETGGYRMAWIGVPQQDAAKTVTPVAWAGEIGQYLAKARITWDDEPRGRGPHGRAIRSGEPQVTQDLGTDPSMAPWLEAARECRFASSVVLPLKDGSAVFAALMIYSPEPGAFDTDELKLLQELANDLAFGIRSLREHVAGEALDKRWRASLEATVGAIANTVEMRDPYTAGHQLRTAKLAVAIARELALPEQQIQGLYLAGIVHDVGKIEVPAEILSKSGKLSKIQYQLIQVHPEAGYEIVKGVDFPWPIAEIVRQHHERLDGSGYPRGLKAEAILPEAKILAVADVVEAMMSHRPYRASLGIKAALAEIEQGKGTLYDPAAVAACVALLERDPLALQ